MRPAGLRRPHFEETAGGFRVTLCGPGEGLQAGYSPLRPGEGPGVGSRWQGLELHPRQELPLNYLLGHGRITNRQY